MELYTSGELAKLCNVSIRTVQYYDSRNILNPSEFSSGGRRLYTNKDLKRMKQICLLKDIGFSLANINNIFTSNNSNDVVLALLEHQYEITKLELNLYKERLDLIKELKKELFDKEDDCLEHFEDVAYYVKNKKKMKMLNISLLLFGLPISLCGCTSLFLWIFKGLWWLFLIWIVIDVIYGIVISKYYFSKTIYICPICHNHFKPSLIKLIFARHNLRFRKLTCTCCGYDGYCLESYKKQEEKYE